MTDFKHTLIACIVGYLLMSAISIAILMRAAKRAPMNPAETEIDL